MAEAKVLHQLCELLRSSVQSSSSAPVLQFENFNEEMESFGIYIKRLENYFALQGLTGDTEEVRKKQREFLMHTMGTKTLQLLCNLTSPKEPNELPYSKLIKILMEYLAPKPSAIAEQNRFSKRVQGEGESIANFVADLKRLSKDCDFCCPHCSSSTVDVHLRQQFIAGVRDTRLLERLIQLREPDNKFTDCVNLALAVEMAQKESKEIQGHHSTFQMSTEVNQMNSFNRKKEDRTRKDDLKCYRCGSKSHLANRCAWRNATCYECGKIGHLARLCLTVSRRSTSDRPQYHSGRNRQNQITDEGRYDREDSGEDFFMNSVQEVLPETKIKPAKIMIYCELEGKKVDFELDTGATVTSMSERQFRTLFPNKELHDTCIKLRTYTGENILPLGYATIKIQYKNQNLKGNLYVIAADVDAVLGREWLQNLQVDWSEMRQIDISSENSTLESILQRFKTVFEDELGKIPNFKGNLLLKEGAVPVFRPPRQIPYAIQDKVFAEIDRLEEKGVFTKVSYSDWGTPLVPVMKSDGSVRLCADYKCTVNPKLAEDKYPIPHVEQLFASLSEGKIFSTLDIRQAYLNMEMTEESALIQAVSTPKGIYKVNRLMFGIKTAPAMWQKYITQLLGDISGVCVFYDDILVQGKDMSQHLKRLTAVLNRLEEVNLRVNKKKCQFCRRSLQYLGHILSEDGISKSQDKIKAIIQAPKPENVTQLRSWLGLVNYYGKFFEHLSSKLHPLYELLQADKKFEWGEKQQEVFDQIKKEAVSDRVLVAYNPKLPLTLATDASPYGISAILSHIMPDGTERPCAYASRSLSSAEKNYSQIDKEATAIYWGVQKFFLYLYGRKFTLITDHKPLVSIFHPEKNLPVLSAQRLLHYAQFLQGFNYVIKYRRSENHGNADALSRLPLNKITFTGRTEEIVRSFQVDIVEQLPVTHDQIAKETAKDPLFKTILQQLRLGTPLTTPGFAKKDHEFSLEQGCITRGSRIVIPESLRKPLLNDLHSGHIGIVKMKALARSYIWWPKIDADIESVTLNCKACCLRKREPPKEEIHPWEVPKGPWQRVHVDYAGPFCGKMFLIVVDAYSKWPEVIIMNCSSSQKTIEALREIFSRFGLPVRLVSDNGTCFTSREFQTFMRENGINHKLTPPYHPASNGQAERFVQTVKEALRKTMEKQGTLSTKLANFLLQYRKTPNATTGVSPAELMLKRDIRTRLDLVRPSLKQVEDNINCHRRFFEVGSPVLARNYTSPQKWRAGKVIRREGLIYWISVEGQIWKRHINQLQRCGDILESERIQLAPESVIPPDLDEEKYEQRAPDRGEERRDMQNTERQEQTLEDLPTQDSGIPELDLIDTHISTNQHHPDAGTVNFQPQDSRTVNFQPRRSTRIRKPVQRLNYA